MIQTIEMTEPEKVAMYMKCTKKKLITMLLENQRLVKHFTPKFTIVESPCNNYFPNSSSTAMECLNCGKGKYQH